MKKLLALSLTLMIVFAVFSTVAVADSGQGEYNDETHDYAINILTENMHEANEDGEIFGIKCRKVLYPESILDEGNRPDRYFIQIYPYYETQTNKTEAGQLAESIRKYPDVIDAWYDPLVFPDENKSSPYLSGVVLIDTQEIPKLENINENGEFEVYGVKCRAVSCSEHLYTSGEYFVSLYLAKGVSEAEAIEKASQDEKVLLATYSRYFYPDMDYYPIMGDVNCDNRVTASDYQLLKRAVLGTYELSESEKYAADINGDGKITAVDYQWLKRLILRNFPDNIAFPA